MNHDIKNIGKTVALGGMSLALAGAFAAPVPGAVQNASELAPVQPGIEQAEAAGNGSKIVKDNSKKSTRVIAGDSHGYQLLQGAGSSASGAAVWGGHWSYGGESMQINSSSRTKAMKKAVKSTLEKHGKCNVYLLGTDNDPESGFNRAKDLTDFAKAVGNWKAKYKGKTVKPKVTVVGIYAPKLDRLCKNYNSYLKAHSANYKNVNGILNKSDYQRNDDHLNGSGIRKVLNALS